MESIRVEALRDKYFPGWKLTGTATPDYLKSVYNIICLAWKEYLEVKKVKPIHVKAKISYNPKTNLEVISCINPNFP